MNKFTYRSTTCARCNREKGDKLPLDEPICSWCALEIIASYERNKASMNTPPIPESDIPSNPWRDIKTDPPQESDFDDHVWRKIESDYPDTPITFGSPAHRGESPHHTKWRHTAQWLLMHRNSTQCVDCGQPHGWGGTYTGPQRCPACVKKLSTPKPLLDPTIWINHCPRHYVHFGFDPTCPGCQEKARESGLTPEEITRLCIVNPAAPNKQINAARQPSLDPKAAAGKLKAPLWLNPPAAEEAMALALALGAEKYGAWNWRTNKVCRSTYISAMKRHIGKILDGEEIDPESGAHHLGHVMANCAIILDAARHGTLVIDGEEDGV